MKLNFPQSESGRSYVGEFLDSLDEVIGEMVWEKLSDIEKFSTTQLFKDKKLEKVSGNVYKINIIIKSYRFRFMGALSEETFYAVNAFHKKTQKIPPEEIKKTISRIKRLNI